MSKINFDDLSPVVKNILITYPSVMIGTGVYIFFHYNQNGKILNFPLQFKNPSFWMRGWQSFVVFGPALSLTAQLTSFNSITDFMKKRTGETNLSSSEVITAATISGAFSAPVSNAAHHIVLHQEKTGKSFGDIFKMIYNSKGGFSRGLGWTAVRQMMFMNIYTTFQLFLEEHIYKNVGNVNASYFTSIISSSIMVAITTQPIMVITAHLYDDPNKSIYNNGFQVMRKLIIEKGLRGLYTGLLYRIFGIVFGLTTIRLTQDQLTQLTNKL